MATPTLIGLTLIAVLGIGASWLASRFNLPSIVLLLLAGFVAGPVTGWVDPDALFGDLLLPIVSLSVAIILFEGGLTLRVVELREAGNVIRNLVTIGVLATWAFLAAGAYWILGLDLGVALLLGAILVVTGPTVIGPILRQLRPTGNVSNVLKWEGILIDPIGVILGVAVFEVLLVGGFQEATAVVALTLSRALIVGVLFGVAGAIVTHQMLRRHWVSDALQNPVTLALVVAVFTACEMVQTEAGLVGATVMGVVLANQEDIAKRHIIEFKENLRVLLISFLFVVLAARIPRDALSVVSWESLLFLGLAVLVARPIAVGLSTIGSELDWSERAFTASMAPRGVVAAAISSVFAIDLAENGYAGADQIVPLTFFVIIGTVTLYGLAAAPLSRFLKVAEPDPQGVLLVGAHKWARELASELDDAGLQVRMLDTNKRNLQAAWDQGLRAQHSSSVTEHAIDEVDIGGIGYLLALTPNDEVNQLTVLNFLEVFDRAHAFQLAPARPEHRDDVARDLRGRTLFSDGVTYADIATRRGEGWTFQTVTISEQGPPPEIEELFDAPVAEQDGRPEPLSEGEPLPLFLIRPDGNVNPHTPDAPLSPGPGDRIVLLAPTDWDPETIEGLQAEPEVEEAGDEPS